MAKKVPVIHVFEDEEDVGKMASDMEAWVEQRCMQVLREAFIKRIDYTGLLTESMHHGFGRSHADACLMLPDGSGQTLLHGAIIHVADKTKQVSYVTALLEFEADANAMDYGGRTPLMLAAGSPGVSAEAFRLLLGRPGLLLGVQDFKGRTALMHAVEANRVPFVRQLADSIVRKNHFSLFLIRNDNGETAEDVARKFQHKMCEKILSKRRLKLLENVQKQLRIPVGYGQQPNPMYVVTNAHRASNRWRHMVGSGRANQLRKTSLSELHLSDILGTEEQIEIKGLERPRSVSTFPQDRSNERRVKPSDEFLARTLLLPVKIFRCLSADP